MPFNFNKNNLFKDTKMNHLYSKNDKSIKYQPAGRLEETRYEKIHNVIFNNANEASKAVAHEIADLIKEKEAQGKPCVLGLATGY